MKQNICLRDKKTICISAPGKVVLCGEHAVLYGSSAISFSIKQRMFVKLTQTDGNDVFVKSDKFGDIHFEFLKNNLKNKKYIQKWCNAIVFLLQRISHNGLKIEIVSDIKDYGFGSSGAMFSCICCGLLLLNNPKMKRRDLLRKTLDIYFDFCKNNKFIYSGIDVATSILGGIICYNYVKKEVANIMVPFLKNYSFFAIWTGHKTSTSDTQSIVNRVRNRKNIYKKIEKITNEIIEIFKTNGENNIKFFFDKLTENQKYLEQLKLADKDIINIIEQCKKQDVACKISGSGLGDCVIAVCEKNKKFIIKKYKKIELKIDFEGIKYEFKQ